jgi:hypothetical protein
MPPAGPAAVDASKTSPDIARSVDGAEGVSARVSIDVAAMRRLARTSSPTLA